MNARISNLHKTEAEWLLLTSWKPEAGEFIIYDPDENFDYARIKVGDGLNYLQDLKFFINETINGLIRSHEYFEILDSGRITDFV